MQNFAYSNSPYPIRPDLSDAYRIAWQALAAPGTWWTGADRVSIACEVRAAQACEFCVERKAALSPVIPLEGGHHTVTTLEARVVDLTHRLTTDPARLSKQWLLDQFDEQITAGHYVEIISVVVTVLCIDSFHRALGFELEPLPEPLAGEPSRHMPANLETETAWVPLIDQPAGEDSDLWQRRRMTNVIRALSLVPDAVRLLGTLSNAQYLEMADIPNPNANGGRALDRAQIEFIAARVSALSDCFY